ncbi:DUF1365 domain-containing protein [Poseidonibacter lekithochrous]|uniref:DUF1365 domain-containing protein n=1 Tax=Poseidonibacter lekithochrous TaxID=1904463 RepID=UPI000D3590F5|nr:DUF1365 domain-containing protein [Poseidonibacter lekithochrous]
MKHTLYDGVIYHKRFHPKEHNFSYKFFMLDIDLKNLDELKNKWFSNNKFNLFSFNTKDHFGSSEDFIENVRTLLKKFELKESSKMRFITLPRILNFVFNPISLLVIFDSENKPDFLLAEVHNYNGGRVIYPIKLNKNNNSYKGEIMKDMYVSPFFNRDGKYDFSFKYDEENVSLKIDLYEENKKMLTASFSGNSLHYNEKNLMKLFLKHTFLTTFVVIRTVWQSLKLYLKGIKFRKAEEIDTKRRH